LVVGGTVEKENASPEKTAGGFSSKIEVNGKAPEGAPPYGKSTKGGESTNKIRKTKERTKMWKKVLTRTGGKGRRALSMAMGTGALYLGEAGDNAESKN